LLFLVPETRELIGIINGTYKRPETKPIKNGPINDEIEPEAKTWQAADVASRNYITKQQ